MTFKINPFEHNKLLGSVNEIGPNYIKAAFTIHISSGQKFFHGETMSIGQVGDFVLIDGQERAIFGRITKVRLPERDRKQIEPSLKEQELSNPIADIQLLASISLIDGKLQPGITKYPQLGSRVYIAPANILQTISSPNSDENVFLTIAQLPSSPAHEIAITPEKLFGRHCAILGATGGGKSWTVARLVEQSKKLNSKVILLDPSGEFWKLDGKIKNLHIGNDSSLMYPSTEVVVPYSALTESDLLALFSPSGQTQAPKLRAAMKSLKLAKLEPVEFPNGFIQKSNYSKTQFTTLYQKHSTKIESSTADFDILHLTRQIQEECVYPSGGGPTTPNHTIWGGTNAAEVGYVVSMLARIEDMVQSTELSSLFNLSGKTSIFDEISNFLKNDDLTCLRISFKGLAFSYNVREIICNSLGRMLLKNARESKFKDKPVLVFLDEAHQFLNKSVGDEYTKFPLDAFDLIAKEGRKYCLNICIATQRPRDIPEGILSQMGTLIVHRLINDRDREIVERASGEIDKSAAAFLPTLGQGQAVIVGVDFPAPLTVQIIRPSQLPDSDGPKYQEKWKKT